MGISTSFIILDVLIDLSLFIIFLSKTVTRSNYQNIYFQRGKSPGPLTPQQLSKSSSSSDETGSIPSVQSVSSASGPNPTYVINIPKDYAGSPLFFPSPATPPIVGASAQFSSPFPDTPISHHTFQQNWNPPLPPGNTPAQTNFCDYRSFIANAQRPSKPSVSLGRGLIGMDFAKTSP